MIENYKANTDGRRFKLVRRFSVGKHNLVEIETAGIGDKFILAEKEWNINPFEFTGKEKSKTAIEVAKELEAAEEVTVEEVIEEVAEEVKKAPVKPKAASKAKDKK
jgi:hypothetical protein